jgi:hypothetical protein
VRLARAVPGAVLLGLALSGCGWFSSSASKTAAACPSAVILRPLANTAVFGAAPERRPDNVAFYGLLSEVDSKCEYTDNAVRMILDVIVIGERGPAAHDDSVDLSYSVAVTGPDQSILPGTWTPLTVHVVFNSNQKRAGVTDHFEKTIPLGTLKGADLSVVLGFRQSPEVVDFYKHFRGR